MLESDRPCRWQLRGSRLTADDHQAEADVVELGVREAAALRSDRSRALTVLGSFEALAGPDSLGRFLIGGRVLDTNIFLGRRCQSEQTALALYRVLHLRGNAFWTGAARWVATEVRGRIESASGAGPVHDLWGEGETHVRFLADAWRLLVSEAERSPNDGRWRAAADRAGRLVEQFSVPFNGGRWYVHDSIELEAGANDLVLNTHTQVMVARLAAGWPVDASARALSTALQQPDRSTSGVLVALALGVTDIANAITPTRLRPRSDGWRLRAHRLAAAHRRAHPHLRGWLGHLARDVGPDVPPPYYLTVNLYDLGALVSNADIPAARHAFTAGVRYAHASGYFRAELRNGTALAPMVPLVLGQSGLHRRGQRAQQLVQRSGKHPAPGWIGYEDQPWRKLKPGST